MTTVAVVTMSRLVLAILIPLLHSLHAVNAISPPSAKVSLAVSVRGGSTSPDDQNVQLVGVGPDPFVNAAPLIVGAVCKDGVLLGALHTIFQDEPLLTMATAKSDDGGDDKNKNQTTTSLIDDLPKGYRGPYRIQSIDSFGTGLVSTGWRADTHILTDYTRLVASEELEIYGEPSSQKGEHYGQFIATDVCSWMAQCALSESTRKLSVVGLLATCGGSDSGYLWLLDATGSYRVRAHAVGRLAGIANSKLQDIDWTLLDKDEAATKLVELLSEILEDGDTSECCVELAYISSSTGSDDQKAAKHQQRRRLERLFSSRLFGIT